MPISASIGSNAMSCVASRQLRVRKNGEMSAKKNYLCAALSGTQLGDREDQRLTDGPSTHDSIVIFLFSALFYKIISRTFLI